MQEIAYQFTTKCKAPFSQFLSVHCDDQLLHTFFLSSIYCYITKILLAVSFGNYKTEGGNLFCNVSNQSIILTCVVNLEHVLLSSSNDGNQITFIAGQFHLCSTSDTIDLFQTQWP